MENLDIAIDFGGSGLKVVASCNDRVIAFRVGPQVIEIVNPKYLEQEFSIDLAKNLWVDYSDAYHALGELAANRYYATVPLVEPKRTYVIPRTLGAIAVAAHRFGVRKFKVNLKLLLPAAEFNKEDAKELYSSLSDALADFICSIGQMKAKLIGFIAKPEGFGLMSRKMKVAGTDYQQARVAVIMFGHRNTSLYLSSGGEPGHYRSNKKGFIRAIEVANVDQEDAIANPKLVDEASVMSYWRANKSWLRENWPKSATTAIVGGGPIHGIGGNITKFLDELLRQNPETPATKTITFLDGGMPLSKYEERNCGIEKDPAFPWLTAWPEDIGINDDDKRQFADVYCLWATGQKVAIQASTNAQ
jgi:hypothetical protein